MILKGVEGEAKRLGDAGQIAALERGSLTVFDDRQPESLLGPCQRLHD